MEPQGDDTASARRGRGGGLARRRGVDPAMRGGGRPAMRGGGRAGGPVLPAEGDPRGLGVLVSPSGLEESPAPPGDSRAAAYKPEPRRPIRIITAPRKPDAGLEMWTRATANREIVCYGRELERLRRSMATIGSGITKVYAGIQLKILSWEEKENAAAAEKKIAEEKRKEEEDAVIAKLGAAEAEQWRREEEEARKRNEEGKERKIALLLSVPRHLNDMSTVLNGLGQIASGGKDAFSAINLMVRGIPYLVKQERGGTSGSDGGSCCSLGTGGLGLRVALDRQVVTRAYDGRLSVTETVTGALSGCLLIGQRAEPQFPNPL